MQDLKICRHKCIEKVLAVLLLTVLLLTGCARNQDQGTASNRTDSMQIYYLNQDGTTIVGVGFTPRSENRDTIISEILDQLEREDLSSDTVSPLVNYSVMGFHVNKHMLSLDISEGFSDLDHITQTLDRAALVSTFCQVTGIDAVGFLVNGTELRDSRGEPYGFMTADQFAKGVGTNIQDYEKTTIRLYFTNEAGTMLVPVTRTEFYNTNIPMEQYVLEQLIQGPRSEGSYPSIPSSTKLTGVTSRDGICYVSLDSSFAAENFTASPEAVIYSIVNTLTELNGINKVQISIGDPPEAAFRDTIALGAALERNLDLIEGYTAPEAGEAVQETGSKKAD